MAKLDMLKNMFSFLVLLITINFSLSFKICL